MRGYVTALLVCSALPLLTTSRPRPVERHEARVAAITGDVAVLRAAAAQGMDLDANGGELLCFAVVRGRTAAVAALLQLGADPDAALGGVTALIVDAGADPTVRSPLCETAQMRAEAAGNAEASQVIREWLAPAEDPATASAKLPATVPSTGAVDRGAIRVETPACGG